MATTVTQSFADFRANTNITDRQEKIVSTCHTNVVRVLGEKLTLHATQPSLVIGSYDRDTLPRYLSKGDVDVMVVLNHNTHADWDNADGTAKALQRMKTILQAEYESTPCGVDRNCVTMQLSEFRLDVVPAFRFTDGSHSIPDTYRRLWLPTQPKKFGEHVTAINKNIGGKFVPFVKMIKAWNAQYTTTRIRSFHLECMLARHYASHTQGYTYQSMANAFFSQLSGYLLGPTYDPISGDRLDEYLDNSPQNSDRTILRNRAQATALSAESATQHEAMYEKTAIEKWKAIFGDFFPAYG